MHTLINYIFAILIFINSHFILCQPAVKYVVHYHKKTTTFPL